jgi:hypothetical protein
MSLKDEISRAVGAHRMYKARLRVAIDAGHGDPDPNGLLRCKDCEFGRWLKTGVALRDQASADFRTVNELHMRFHERANEILDLARKGKHAAAHELLEPEAPFSVASTELTAALFRWLENVVRAA